MTKIKAAITAVGGYVPDYVLTNDILATMVDTNDEWIVSRTGIKERRILKEPGQGTSFMAIKAAQQLLEKARDDFQKIVNAPQANKTSMLHLRSLYSLAYCLETLGDLPAANKNYETLIAEANDSAFSNLALQGLERTADKRYAALYEKFKNYEKVEIGEAPGAELPNRPLIDLPPEIEAPNNDFVPKNLEKPAEEKPATEEPKKAEGEQPTAGKDNTP